MYIIICFNSFSFSLPSWCILFIALAVGCERCSSSPRSPGWLLLLYFICDKLTREVKILLYSHSSRGNIIDKFLLLKEVFVDPGRDESLIIELLDLKVDVADHGSATWFLQDLASEQDAEAITVKLKSLTSLFFEYLQCSLWLTMILLLSRLGCVCSHHFFDMENAQNL